MALPVVHLGAHNHDCKLANSHPGQSTDCVSALPAVRRGGVAPGAGSESPHSLPESRAGSGDAGGACSDERSTVLDHRLIHQEEESK